MSLPSLLLSYCLLDCDPDLCLEYTLSLLNSDELADLYGRNYRTTYRRMQYVYGRLLLKSLLCHPLGVNVDAISVRGAANGQPRLYILGEHVEDLSISISHDREHVLVGAGFGCKCGVDIQRIKKVDWSLVARTMGWSGRIESLLEVWSAMPHGVSLDRLSCSALVWSAYEAWMKSTACSLKPSDFDWQDIRFLSTDAVAQRLHFEMILQSRSAYSPCRIIMSLRSDEVIAVAIHKE